MLRCETLTGDALVDLTGLGKDFEFTDDHMHLDPRNGRGVGAAKDFEAAGGRNLFLVNKGLKDAGIELKNASSFESLFDYTIGLAREVAASTHLRCFAVVGVHPAEVATLCKKLGVEKALNLGKKAMAIAVEKVKAGEAVALGEVGLPHFPVEKQVNDACMSLLSNTLELAAGVDCAVQLHTGSVDENTLIGYGEMARKAGLDTRRVVKHFSPPMVKAAMEAGIFPSIVARAENIKKARKEGNRFLMESDFIDDLKRPDAVVSPTSVPKVSKQLHELGVLDEDDLWRIHVDNVEEVYGVSLG